MIKQTLEEFCEGRTQSEVAEAMGRTQGAISQMLKAGRKIHVEIDDSGKVTWYEAKRLIPRSAA